MSADPLVSIVIISYNQAQFLGEAILSVLNQDHSNTELLVIDGGSTDGSMEIIRKHSDRLGYWISEPDNGPEDAVNKGFARARGEFLGLLPSDDILLPDAISRKVALFKLKPYVDFVYGDVEVTNEAGRALLIRRGNSLPYREWVRTCTMPIGFQSVLMKRSVVERVGAFDSKRQVTSDWDFLLRAGLKCRMEYLPGIAGRSRYQPGSHSATRQLEWIASVGKMYNDYFARNDLPNEIRILQKEALASTHLYGAYLLLDYASSKAALKQVLQALRQHRPLVYSPRFGKLLLLFAMGAWGRALWRRIAKRPGHDQPRKKNQKNTACNRWSIG